MPDGLKVFIVGSPRSGTSITYYAMREVMGLPGYGESHVFPIFQRLIHEFYQYSQGFSDQTEVLAQNLDTRLLKLSFFEYIRNLYQRVYKGENWVDKTPGGESIQGIPMILDVFPSAKILIARRTGIEAVTSIMKKFSVSLDQACSIWTGAAQETLKIRRLGLPVIEVDQFDMANSAASTGTKIAAFLERPDKAVELGAFFKGRRTDKLSVHDWTRRVTLADTDWPAGDKATFIDLCGPMMHAFGYPM